MELKVLSTMDTARPQWFHLSALIISGMGFFTDAYDLFCIPPVSSLLGSIYYDDVLPIHVKALVNGIAICGAFAGQLIFGWLGDRMRRRKVYGFTLALMIASSIGSGFSIGRSRESVIASLCFFRFWLGVGIGGDFPVSATIMAEYSNTNTRGGFMAAVFAMQGVGILAGSTVAMTVSACFKAAYKNPTFEQQDIVWRIILMLGAVPAGFTYYWRMKVPETARFTALETKSADQPVSDMSKVLGINITEDKSNVSRIQKLKPIYGLFSWDFVKNHGRHLLGTMSCWFFLDIPFYCSNLFQKDIYRAVGWLRKSDGYSNPLDEIFHIARAQAVVALCGTLPGSVFTVFMIDRVGRFPIQLFGFFFMSAFSFSLAIPYETYWLQKSHCNGFLAIYSFTFFFTMFGPSTTAFIVPAELFPARLRSTCHGISAAAGKAGAVFGAFGLLYAAQPKHKNSPDHERGYPTGIGVRKGLILVAVASFMGFLCTFLIPETNGRSLGENEGESVCESGTTTGYTDYSIDNNNKLIVSSPLSVNNYSLEP